MKRNWRLARGKVEEEWVCRVCGRPPSVLRPGERIEAAHVIGREHDRDEPIRGYQGWRPGHVSPDRVVPLCGPATDTRTCHGKQHAGRLELLPHLTLNEQLQAVADAGGIEQARARVIPRRLREERDAVDT